MGDSASFNDPGDAWQLLAAFTSAGENDQHSQTVDRVTQVIQGLGLEAGQLESVRQDLSRSLESAYRRLYSAGGKTGVPVRVWISDQRKNGIAPQEFGKPAEMRTNSHGWGYFLTTRASSPSGGKLGYFIDLFLYNEVPSES